MERGFIISGMVNALVAIIGELGFVIINHLRGAIKAEIRKGSIEEEACHHYSSF